MARPRRTTPPPATKPVRIPVELHERISKAAEERMVGPGLLVRVAIEDMLERLVPVEEFRSQRQRPT